MSKLVKNHIRPLISGKSLSKNEYEIAFLTERLAYKKELKKPREMQLQAQAYFMQSLMPHFGQLGNAKNYAVPERQLIYSSALLHVTWGMLAYGATKLSPDFMKFQPEQTLAPESMVVDGVNIGYIHSLARKKGGWVKACKEAQRDLVRGESYIWQGYSKNQKGENVGLEWKHVPWSDVCWEWGDTDVMIVQEMSVYDFIKQFGEDMLSKVTEGELLASNRDDDYLDHSTITPYEMVKKKIQKIVYIDPARLIYKCYLGGNGYKYADYSGRQYPFMREDETGFCPLKRRVFYPEAPGGSYSGYGPLDLLIPLARLENNIVNSSAIKAIKSANKMVVIPTNDVQDAEMKYDQYLDQAISSSYQKPFFMSNVGTGTTMTPQIIDEGSGDSTMQYWEQFILNQATIRTRLNYMSLTELASTAAQDEMKIQMEQSANKIVLNSNRDIDQEMAMDDLYLLKNGDSCFHDLKVYLQRSLESLGGQWAEGQEPPPKIVRIGKYIKQIEAPNFNVTPMVDGIFDNMDMQEIRAMKEAVALFAGTVAGAKAGKIYADEVLPKAKITEADFMAPQLPPSPVTGEEQQQPVPNNLTSA